MHSAPPLIASSPAVLVTGAGGSIGTELVRQISAAGPATLTLLDHGEYALYTIDQEVRALRSGLRVIPVLADVRDPARLADGIAEAWAVLSGHDGPIGPVHLEVPMDVLQLPAADGATRPDGAPPAADPDAIAAATALLAAAARPALILGGGARAAAVSRVASAGAVSELLADPGAAVRRNAVAEHGGRGTRAAARPCRRRRRRRRQVKSCSRR